MKKQYGLYVGDELVMSFYADRYLRHYGIQGTISVYGVSAKDEEKISRYVAPEVQLPSENKARLYKVFRQEPS